ncbi:MAG: hypothetical protein KBC35_00585 [Candidatus Pacebacteria bacterium]|nr:hypothetical protein [Candidatus Paceibacterota bacterium]
MENFGGKAEAAGSKAQRILEEARAEGEALREYQDSLPEGDISDEKKTFYALEKEYSILNGALNRGEISPDDTVVIQQRMEEILAENPKFIENAQESAKQENTQRERDER